MPLAGILWLLTFEQAKVSNSPRGEKKHYIWRTASEYALRGLCTPKDVLARDAHIQSIKTGDLVAFPYAGAYAWHISSHDFLKHPPPEQIYI